jgi:hypothetical protein
MEKEGKEPIGSQPGTNVNNGQSPENTQYDSEKKEKKGQDIPASQADYNNPGKAKLRDEADEMLEHGQNNDDEDRFDINSLKGEIPNR